MNKFAKYITGLVACVALVMSGMPVQAETVQGLPRRTASHITSATTTTPMASAFYATSIVVKVTSATTATVTIQDKGGTPKVLYTTGSISAGNTTPVVVIALGTREASILMAGGLDIVTTGTIVVDVWVTGYSSP